MIPILLQNLITETVALAGTFMVGVLGEQYLAAATIAATPLFVFMIITFGVQSSITILVSQYWGKGDTDAINRVLGAGLYFVMTLSLANAIIAAIIPHQILILITNDTDLVILGAPYVRIVGFAMLLNAISLVYIASQRSMGNARLGVVVLAISSAFSIFGNWVLIYGNLGMPALGMEGAAISLLCAHALAVIILSVYAFRNTRLPLKLKLLLKPGLAIFKDFIKYASTVLLNEALFGFGTMLYPVIFGHMADAQSTLAAYNIAGNVERIFTVSMIACGSATAVIVGREIGAGRQDAVKSVAKALIKLSIIIGLASGALLLFAQFTIIEPFVFPLFELSAEAASDAAIMLIILVCVTPLRALGFTMGVGVLRAGGDVKRFLLIDVGTLYLIALPMALIAGFIFNAGIMVIYMSTFVENVCKTALLSIRVRSKKWINNVTRDL